MYMFQVEFTVDYVRHMRNGRAVPGESTRNGIPPPGSCRTGSVAYISACSKYNAAVMTAHAERAVIIVIIHITDRYVERIGIFILGD